MKRNKEIFPSNEIPIRIFIIGPGLGKSTFLNWLGGAQHFPVRQNLFQTCTTNWELWRVTLKGRIFDLIDCPGYGFDCLFDKSGIDISEEAYTLIFLAVKAGDLAQWENPEIMDQINKNKNIDVVVLVTQMNLMTEAGKLRMKKQYKFPRKIFKSFNLQIAEKPIFHEIKESNSPLIDYIKEKSTKNCLSAIKASPKKQEIYVIPKKQELRRSVTKKNWDTNLEGLESELILYKQRNLEQKHIISVKQKEIEELKDKVTVMSAGMDIMKQNYSNLLKKYKELETKKLSVNEETVYAQQIHKLEIQNMDLVKKVESNKEYIEEMLELIDI